MTETPATPMPDTTPPMDPVETPEEGEGEKYDGGDIPEVDPDVDEAPDEE